MTVHFYLQRRDNTLLWERVDTYIWDNYEHALAPDQESRYTGNKVRVENHTLISIEARDLTPRDMSIIMRFCGVRGNEAPGSVPAGFVRDTEFVPFRKGKREWLHQIGGTNFVAKKAPRVTPDRVDDNAPEPSDCTDSE